MEKMGKISKRVNGNVSLFIDVIVISISYDLSCSV